MFIEVEEVRLVLLIFQTGLFTWLRVKFVHVLLRQLVIDEEERIDDVFMAFKQEWIQDFSELQMRHQILFHTEDILEGVNALKEDFTVLNDDSKTGSFFLFFLTRRCCGVVEDFAGCQKTLIVVHCLAGLEVFDKRAWFFFSLLATLA